MEPENVVNALAVYFRPNEDLVIAVIQLFAPHDAHALQFAVAFDQVSKSDCGDVCASQIKLFHKLELGRDVLQTFIFNLCATKEIEFSQVLQLFQLDDTRV